MMNWKEKYVGFLKPKCETQLNPQTHKISKYCVFLPSLDVELSFACKYCNSVFNI